MKARKRNRPFSFHSASLFTFSNEGNVDSVSVHKRLLMFIQMVGLCQVVVVVKHERAQLSQHRPQVTVQYSTVSQVIILPSLQGGHAVIRHSFCGVDGIYTSDSVAYAIQTGNFGNLN